MVATERMAEVLRDKISTDITYLSVGANIAVSTPVITDTLLDYEIDRNTVSSTNTDTDRKVIFQHIFGVDEANGFACKEVALFEGTKTALEDGEVSTDWTATGDAAVTTDSTIKQIGTNSIKTTLTNSGGTGTITKTTSIGDISAITGTTTTPTGGSIHLKIYPDTLANMTKIEYRIGSSSSDYGSASVTLASLTEDTWYGWNIDMTDLTITGSPSWAAVDYQAIIVTETGNCILYMDDVWVSKNACSRNTVPTLNKTNLYELIYDTTVTVTPK